jgi:iron(III) transport system substrate-binding protein
VVQRWNLAIGVVVLVAAAGGVAVLLIPPEPPDVVLYCSVDQDQSQPVAARFTEETGLRVDYHGEMEAQRSVGLARRLHEEAARPRADVFWANEIMNTVWLAEAGVLDPLPEGVAELFPEAWRDPEGRHIRFGVRARVLLVNTELLPDPAEHPTSLRDLVDARWSERGLLTCMAAPLTGTTYTHAVALLTRHEEDGRAFLEAVARSAEEGRTRIVPSNGSVMSLVREARNRVAFGLTDTDDAWVALREGFPVKVVYPDGRPGEGGTMVIPNTAALVRGRPHPEAAEKLLRWIAGPAVEEALARGPSAQMPVRPDLAERLAADPSLGHLKRPGIDFLTMPVDWQEVGRNRDRWHDLLDRLFRPGR